MYVEYGPLVKENIGGKVIVHVFDPEDIKEDQKNSNTKYLMVQLQIFTTSNV